MKIQYKCGNCKFEFSRHKSVEFNNCPYCGREGTFDIKRSDEASRLLDEVSRL